MLDTSPRVVLVQSHPNSTKMRKDLVLSVSKDNGKSLKNVLMNIFWKKIFETNSKYFQKTFKRF